jgi:exosortase family protein XrtF
MKAFTFLLVFLVVYVVLQLLYTLYLAYYNPHIDPFSYYISTLVIKLFNQAEITEIAQKSKILISVNGKPIVNIMEACNGVSVFITLWSFILAYRNKLWHYTWYIPLSFIALFLANLARIYLLIQIKMNVESIFVFFHEYVFPIILYLFAFGFMMVWVKLATKEKNIHASAI